MHHSVQGVHYLLADHLGSAVEVADSMGVLVGRQRYYPYGAVRYLWGSMPTTYNYTGQRLDSTGLLYYGARYYDPRIGRFTQADSIVPQPGNPQSLNRYAYTLNNPLRYTDPTGHYIYEGGYNDDYDPTHHSYTLPNTAGLLGAEVWFLGPEDAAAIYGVATPMRVAMWSVVAVSDQPGALVNQGSVAAAAAFAAAVPRNPGPSSLGGVVAPKGIGADPWEAGAWRTSGSGASQPSQTARPKFWNQTTTFEGTKVYQRNDLIDPGLTDASGRTNLERMKQGKAPIGPDGRSIQLHHMLQTDMSPIAEVTETFHQRYYNIIHINTGELPSGIDRSAFNTWRGRYWQYRYGDFIR